MPASSALTQRICLRTSACGWATPSAVGLAKHWWWTRRTLMTGGNTGTDEKLHVVESLSRVDANTLLYKATVEDPATFTGPWTMEYPFTATTKRIFEYACNEGNYALPTSWLAHANRRVPGKPNSENPD